MGSLLQHPSSGRRDSARPLRRLAGRFQVQLLMRFLSIVLLLAVVISVLFFQSVSAHTWSARHGCWISRLTAT